MPAEDEVSRNRSLRVRATGPEEVRRILAALNDAFPDATFSIEERVTDERGDRTVVWSGRGTNTGRVGDTAPTNESATILIVADNGGREGTPKT